MFFRLLSVGVVLFGVSLATASDQTILGQQIQVKDPQPGVDATKRKLIGKGLEKASLNTIVGDPTASGATLTISADGDTSSAQTFDLPTGSDPSGKPFWKTLSTGFAYKDSAGTNGPVKTAQIKKSTKGTFQIKTTVGGKLGAIAVVPPNPGTAACMLFAITGGDSYHVLLPPGADSTITKNDAKTFLIKNALVEGLCPTPTTSSTSTSSSSTASSTSTTSTSPTTIPPSTTTTVTTSTVTTTSGAPTTTSKPSTTTTAPSTTTTVTTSTTTTTSAAPTTTSKPSTTTTTTSSTSTTLAAPTVAPAQVTVSEANLPNGTHENHSALTGSVDVTVSAASGLAAVRIFGVTIAGGGIPGFFAPIDVDTPLGVLHVTSFAGGVTGGVFSCSYTLQDNALVAATTVQEALALEVTDGIGRTALGSLAVHVLDDAPLVAITDGTDTNLGSTSVRGKLAAIGADTEGAHVALTLGAMPPGLSSSTVALTYAISPDGSVITAKAGTETVFTVTGEPDGYYVYQQAAPLDLEVVTTDLQSSVGAGGPQPAYYLYTDGRFGSVENAADWLLKITGSGDVYPSTQGMGVANNIFEKSATLAETLTFEFDDEGASSVDLGLQDRVYLAKIGVTDFSPTETLTYVAFYTDGTNSGAITVHPTDLVSGVFVVQAPAGTYLDRLELAAGPTTTSMRFTSLVAFGFGFESTTHLNFGMIATDGDGDAVSGSFTITVANTSCGDGLQLPGEQCDPYPPTIPNVSGDGCSVTCQSEAPFEIEPNGSIATATPLWPGWSEWRGWLTQGGDNADYFTFKLAGPGIVTLVTHDPGAAGTCGFDTRIHLLDGLGVELAQDDDSGPASCSQIGPGLLPAGTYYVWVERPFGSQPIAQYQLDLTIM